MEKKKPHSNIFSHWEEAESDAQCTKDVHALDYVIFSTLGENLKIVEVRLKTTTCEIQMFKKSAIKGVENRKV